MLLPRLPVVRRRKNGRYYPFELAEVRTDERDYAGYVIGKVRDGDEFRILLGSALDERGHVRYLCPDRITLSSVTCYFSIGTWPAKRRGNN